MFRRGFDIISRLGTSWSTSWLIHTIAFVGRLFLFIQWSVIFVGSWNKDWVRHFKGDNCSTPQMYPALSPGCQRTSLSYLGVLFVSFLPFFFLAVFFVVAVVPLLLLLLPSFWRRWWGRGGTVGGGGGGGGGGRGFFNTLFVQGGRCRHLVLFICKRQSWNKQDDKHVTSVTNRGVKLSLTPNHSSVILILKCTPGLPHFRVEWFRFLGWHRKDKQSDASTLMKIEAARPKRSIFSKLPCSP